MHCVLCTYRFLKKIGIFVLNKLLQIYKYFKVVMNPELQHKFKVSILCFSKDRPFQLEQFLRSYIRFFPSFLEIKFIVLWKSNEIYLSSYHEIFSRHPEIISVRESNFCADLLSCLNIMYMHAGKGVIQFCVDDMIFQSNPFLRSVYFN